MQTTQAIAVKTLNSSRFWHWQLKFLYDTLKLYFSPKRRHLIIKNKKKRRSRITEPLQHNILMLSTHGLPIEETGNTRNNSSNKNI